MSLANKYGDAKAFQAKVRAASVDDYAQQAMEPFHFAGEWYPPLHRNVYVAKRKFLKRQGRSFALQQYRRAERRDGKIQCRNALDLLERERQEQAEADRQFSEDMWYELGAYEDPWGEDLFLNETETVYDDHDWDDLYEYEMEFGRN